MQCLFVTLDYTIKSVLYVCNLNRARAFFKSLTKYTFNKRKEDQIQSIDFTTNQMKRVTHDQK